MSNPTWVKKYLKMKPEVTAIFDTLDQYRDFCVRWGFVFNEAHVGNDKSPWADFQRSLKGKEPRDHWDSVIEYGKRNYQG